MKITIISIFFLGFQSFFAQEAEIAGADELREGRRAAEFFAKGDLVSARSIYVRLLEKKPGDSRILANLGAVEYQAGRVEKAMRYLEEAVAREPHLSSTWFLLGMIYKEDGQKYHSISAFSRAVHEDPRNAAAHQMLAVIMRENGWDDAAETELRRSLEIDPEDADANFNLALVLLEKKNPEVELARHHYRKAVEKGAKPDPEFEKRLEAQTAPKKEE